MIPGMDPKAMRAAMKKMGMKQEEIPADAVIIKSGNKDIIIENPQVVKINMMGQDSFQITGSIREETKTETVEISADDIKMVAEKTGKSEDEAKEALEAANGDIAQAIMDLEA